MNKVYSFFKNEKQRLNLLLVIAFALFSLFIVFHHEIWRDEAYVWVLCRDCGFFELLKNAAIEGHPPLWYLLVLPLAKSGLSVFSMQILAWFFAVCGAAFFVFNSPFGNFLKFTFLFSSGMFYWHAVIARSYSLFPLLIFLLAYLYPMKKEHPYVFIGVLILIANVHVILFGFCAAVLGVFLWEDILKNKDTFKNKLPQITAFSIALADFLLTGIFILIGKAHNVYIAEVFVQPGFWEVFQKWTANINGMKFFAPLFVVFLLWFAFILFKENKKMLFIFSVSFLSQYLIYKYIWGSLPSRAFSLFFIVLFCLWIILKKRTKMIYVTEIIIAVIFLSSFLNGTKYVTQDMLYEFSGSKNIAAFIKNKLPQNAILLMDDTETKSGIFAFLPDRKFWSLRHGEFHTVERWDVKPMQQNFFILPGNFVGHEMYLITQRLSEQSFPKELNVIPVYVSPVKVIDENEDFIIYRLTENKKNNTEKIDEK